MRLAPVGRCLIGVDQHHINSGIGRHIGDARPHHPGSDHPQPLHRLIRHRGARRPLFQRFLVDEQAADHRGGRRVHQHMGKPPRLDLQRHVKRHQRAFVHRRQQCLGGGIDPLGLAVDHRRGPDKHHVARRVIGGTTRHLVILAVPRLDQISGLGGQNPLFRPRQQLFGGDHLINDPGGFHLVRAVGLAFQQPGRSPQRPEFAHQPCGATGTGENPHHDLRQPDPGTRRVGGDDAVAGQRQFQPDPQRGAGQRRHDRFGPQQGLGINPGALDLAQDGVHRHHAVKQPARRVIAGICLHPGDDVQIHPPGKILFAGGDDDAFDRRIGQCRINQPGQFGQPRQ